MPTRNAIVLILVTAALSGAASFTGAAIVLQRGPVGPAGPTGPAGPVGRAEVDPRAVLGAIAKDPEAVARSLSGHLDYEDIQQNLDPDPADVQGELDTVKSDVGDVSQKLDGLCSDLSLSDAVANDLSSC